ncbi:MAG: response regulator transcription factor [Oscillospiraceae bacterium]|nr:response regulator transcription factor [Oscillospiraceae bacterium]
MIWCVEDDAGIRDIEVYALESTGFEAKGFEDGESFFAALEKDQPDLVILDVMLPGEDGTKILKEMKGSAEYCDIPVIMATAKGAEFDKVKSLDMGADDYLVKPFGMMEMVSRVKAVLRRCKPIEKSGTITLGMLTINTEEREAVINGEKLQLTYKEFELLKLFMQNPKTVFTRDRLYSEIWGYDYVGETRTVDVHIRSLRQKLGEYADMIETVRSVGYRMSDSGGKNNDR